MISLDDRPVGGLETWLLLRDELSVALGFALEFLHGMLLMGLAEPTALAMLMKSATMIPATPCALGSY